MFGLGMGEIAIILVLALILLGPQKLPDAAKPQKPTLVEPPGGEDAAAAMVPAGGNPDVPGEVPSAHASNVPGLEAALVEIDPPPAAPARPAAPPTAEPAAKAM